MTSLPEPPGLDALRQEAEDARRWAFRWMECGNIDCCQEHDRCMGADFALTDCCKKWRALGRAEGAAEANKKMAHVIVQVNGVATTQTQHYRDHPACQSIAATLKPVLELAARALATEGEG